MCVLARVLFSGSIRRFDNPTDPAGQGDNEVAMGDSGGANTLSAGPRQVKVRACVCACFFYFLLAMRLH